MLKKSIFLSSSILLVTCSWADVKISGGDSFDYKSSETTDSGIDLNVSSKSDSGMTMTMSIDMNSADGLDNQSSYFATEGTWGSLKISAGNDLYLSDTRSPSNDGEVGTEIHGGASIGYLSQTLSGMSVHIAHSANDDDASATSVGAGYVIALGDAGSIGIAAAYTDSDDGDTTLMPQGGSFGVSYAMGDFTVSAKTTEGNNYDRATVGGIKYKTSDDLTVGLSYTEVKNAGEYDRDTDTTTLSAHYTIARGLTASLAYNMTDGYSDADSVSTSSNSTSFNIRATF